MLSNASIIPTLPAVDLDRAKKFYSEKLGLKEISISVPDSAMFEAGEGTKIFIYKRGATKADHTAANFSVEDIESEVKALQVKGVSFEEYDIPEMGIKTVNGIATLGQMKSAWFKDSEGNILGISNSAK